jgi:diguanylate cyclase (GGDEF)-like protein/PAS domain S-box-containing protein
LPTCRRLALRLLSRSSEPTEQSQSFKFRSSPSSLSSSHKLFMETVGRQRLARPFLFLIAGAGAVVCLLCAYRLNTSNLDGRFILLALLTLGIGSRLGVKIHGAKGEITVSDTIIFLTMLLFDGEAAVLLAAAEALCTSLRLTRKKLYWAFNSSVMACSTFVTVEVLRLNFGPLTLLGQGSYSNTFIIALCSMALVQYIFNSSIVATATAFRTNQPVWLTWNRNYLWTSITYFAGASAAGIIAKLIGVVGFYAFIAAIPIIAIVYFTYWTYLKKVETSAVQVEMAERHLAALQESEERFRSAFDYAAIGMALVAPDGRLLQINRSLCEILGYTEQELLATSYQAITHPDDLPTTLLQMDQLHRGVSPAFQLEKRYQHKVGHTVWVLLTVSLFRDRQSKSSRFIFQIQDITDRKRAEDRLLHDAFHDGLTGLPNRALFVDHLKLAIERSKRGGEEFFGVLFLDLDRFKIINDSLGHMVGDQLLIGIARRLEDCLRPGDTVARLGGDEFTVLLEDVQKTDEIIQVAERLQKELSLPFNIGGHEVFTTVSIGIALSNLGYDQPENLLRDADTAMYRAKSLGKARHEIFDKAMHDSAMDMLQVETDLRRAVERDEFFVQYQPIVSFETGQLRGFEALVRWRHPERGSVSPGKFIPLAEETGLISIIGQKVLRESCRQLREWQQKYSEARSLSVSVNLSSKQFTQNDLTAQIRQVLHETGLKPECLHLEITESVVMENTENAIAMLKELRSLGVKLSIDDFGTGYSSLSYLHRFPFDTLKIDRSFVGCMEEQSDNAEIVRTILVLAHNLGMDVVAEGVETEEQLAILRAMHCQCGQGFLFSKPEDAEVLEQFLTGENIYLITPESTLDATLVLSEMVA